VDVSTWTGDPLNASFISGQLRLLYENMTEAKSILKGELDKTSHWWENSADDNVNCPALHLTV
jgi:Rogdi leucine zipper containing protein